MVAACPAVRLCAVGPTLKVPRMGHVHPIKPRQRLVVFPLRRKRTADWTADAASDNYAEALPQLGRGNHGRAGRTRPFRTVDATPDAPARQVLISHLGHFCHFGHTGPVRLRGAAVARQQKGQALRARRRACPRQPVMVRAGRWHRDGEVKGWGPPERDARWTGRPADATARTSWSGQPKGRPPGRQEVRPVKAAFSARPRTRKRSTRECGHAR
jgi:hypothetical protein